MRLRAGVFTGVLFACAALTSCGGGGGGGGTIPPGGGPTPVPTGTPSTTRTGDVVTRFQGPNGNALAYDSDDKILLVAAGAQVFNAASGALIATVPIDDSRAYVPGLAYDAPRHAIYVASLDTLYRTTTAGVMTQIATGFRQIEGIAVDPAGTVYVVDDDHISTVSGGTVSRLTAAGTVTNTGATTLALPRAAFDTRDGMLYFTDPLTRTIKRATASGAVSVVAGSCVTYSVGGQQSCIYGDFGGTGAAARFGTVGGIVYDADDDLFFVADGQNNQLWSLKSDGTATIVAGYGAPGIIDGNGRFAFLNDPLDVAYAGDARTAYVGQLTFTLPPQYIVASYAAAGLPAPALVFPVQTSVTPSRTAVPGDLALAPDGSAWFVEPFVGTGHATAAGTVTDRPFVRNWGGGYKIAIDADGTPWVTANHYNQVPDFAGLLRLNGDGSQTDVPVPNAGPGPPNIFALAGGPDGNLWFGAGAGFTNRAGVADRVSGNVTTFSTPANPRAIVAGPDGNVWLSSRLPDGSPALAKIDVHGAAVGSATPLAQTPIAFARAADGSVWYVDGQNTVSRIGPSGTESATTLCHSAGCFTAPAGIASARDGSIWFVETNAGDVARIDASGTIIRYLLPRGGFGGIAVRADGRVWVDSFPDTIYLLDPAAYDAGHLPHPSIASTARKPATRDRGRGSNRARWQM